MEVECKAKGSSFLLPMAGLVQGHGNLLLRTKKPPYPPLFFSLYKIQHLKEYMAVTIYPYLLLASNLTSVETKGHYHLKVSL